MNGENTYDIAGAVKNSNNNIFQYRVHQFNPDRTPLTQQARVKQLGPDGNTPRSASNNVATIDTSH